jgi:phosphoglycerate dehydrogenase-like enzyme
MTRVVLMEDYADHARTMPCVRELEKRVDLKIFTTRAASQQEVVTRLQGASAAITIRDRVLFDAQVLEQAGDLKLLSVCGNRLRPHIDLEAATRKGILVAAPPLAELLDGPMAAHRATAEMAMTLVLALLRDVLRNHEVVRSGGWDVSPGRGVSGKTLGIVGLGKIGGPVARLAKAFGMRVLAWSPRLTEEKAIQWGAQSVPLPELLAQSDVVSLHAEASPQTAGLIGREQLAQMRRGAYLVNTARATLLDEDAFRTALQSGHLAGAGLDVYWEEPLPASHWLRSQANVVLQPHVGGFTEEGYEWLVAPAVANVIAWLDGAPRQIANPELLAR